MLLQTRVSSRVNGVAGPRIPGKENERSGVGRGEQAVACGDGYYAATGTRRRYTE